MRKLLLLGALTAVLLGTTATSASATTWDGNCTLTGTLYLIKPYTILVEHNDYIVRGTGTCRGKLDGEAYDGPVELFIDGRMDKPMSCQTGVSVSVPGTLTFGGSASDVDAAEVL